MPGRLNRCALPLILKGESFPVGEATPEVFEGAEAVVF